MCRVDVTHFGGRFVKRVRVLGSLISPRLGAKCLHISFPKGGLDSDCGSEDLRVLGDRDSGTFLISLYTAVLFLM